uniref:N-acetyltransferase domain-containing protein n=2 Tax=Mesocestoides corti TaxID=53468 RepID=A0A5K3EKI4_MESCO
PIGFLKVGEKKLFLFNNYGEYFEVEPVCVLDFYIKEECQRKGYGRELFEDMLRREGLVATDLPIDSPSAKMLAFMQKHYNQDEPIRQSNNYVVFPAFFLHVDSFLVPRSRRLGLPILVNNVETVAPPNKSGRCVPLLNRTTQTAESESSYCPSVTKGSISSTLPKPSSPSIPSEQKVSVAKARAPELRERVSVPSLRQDLSSLYSKRIGVTTPSAPAVHLHLDNILRLNTRQQNYNYRTATWTHNRHTRLW